MTLSEVITKSMHEGLIILALLLVVAAILASTKEIPILFNFLWAKIALHLEKKQSKTVVSSNVVVKKTEKHVQQSSSDNIGQVQPPLPQKEIKAKSSSLPVCTNCGYQGKPKLVTKGSIFIEIVGWCCFFIPGFVYTLWRHASRYKACPACGAPNMVPANSPIAQKMLND